MTDIKIFNKTEFKQLPKKNKNEYMGVVYAAEYTNGLVKIGSTINPQQRALCLLHQAEGYGSTSISRIAISSFHTNYRENEISLHKKFVGNRKSDTELFAIEFEKAVKSISNMKLLDETAKKKKSAENFKNGMIGLFGWLNRNNM